MNSKLLRNSAVGLCATACLFAVGWLSHSWYQSRNIHLERRVKASGYRFTSPLLDVELPEGFSVANEPILFKYKISDFVNLMTDGTRVRHISVYYRDLGDGPWLGINEHQKFNPASMMKVPVMVAWLRRAEKNPGILKQTFLFDNKVDLSEVQHNKPKRTLVSGHHYSVEQLLEYMLSYSDNNATSILYNNLSTIELDAVMDGMDVTNRPENGHNSITVHGYSGFFRILYNASFLSRGMSEKALQLLSNEDFQGISAGVPKGVTVAAKFGEYESDDSNEGKQLHEFGIVYHPKGAYILGIMTQGNDLARQTETIRDISTLIYREIDSTPSGNRH